VRGVLWISLAVLLIFGTWHFTRLPAFTIEEVTIDGGETISHESIRSRVTDELTGTYFLLIPKRFTYLYPQEDIIERVEDIPRVHTVTMSRTSRTALAIFFEEHIPHALWCVSGTTMCWFINAQGYAFAEAPALHGGTFVRHTIEGLEDIREGTAIEEGLLTAIDLFMERVKDELGFRITSLFHKKNGDIEFEVNGGGLILTSGRRDFKETFENLRSVLSASEFDHLAPGNFRYVDVRFENKVFVNEELVVESAATTEEAEEILSE
jgi:cell division septal protein FtsQ